MTAHDDLSTAVDALLAENRRLRDALKDAVASPTATEIATHVLAYTRDENSLWVEVASEHRHASPRVWCRICDRIAEARS